MARTLLASTLAGAAALRATRTTVSMHTNIFPTFTIKDKAAVLGQRLLPRRRDFFALGASCVYAWCCCGCVLRAAAAARAGGPFGDARARRARAGSSALPARRAGRRRAAAAAAARPVALRRTASALRESMGSGRRHTAAGRARATACAVDARGERRAQTTPYQHRPSPSSTSASRTRRLKVDASTTAGR
jgi:hypothetical protein